MRLVPSALLVLGTLGLFAQPSDSGVVGNKDVRIYHLPTCKLILKIKPESKVPFASREEATRAGYAPCKLCVK